LKYSEIASQVFVEYMRANYPDTSDDKIREIAKNAGAKNIYHSNLLTASENGIFSPMKNGQESQNDILRQGSSSDLANYLASYNVVDDKLASSFILPNNGLKNGQIPIIINYAMAENILGIKPLANSASDQAKYDQIAEIREKISELSINVCYRNSSSVNNFQNAINDNQDPTANLQYNLNLNCLESAIASDSRTADQKISYEQQQKIVQNLPSYIAPKTQILTLKVVGLMPNSPTINGDNAEQFLKNLASSTLDTTNGSPVVPRELFAKNVLASDQKLFANPPENTSVVVGNDSFIVEFGSAESLRDFIAKYNCGSDYCAKDLSLKIQSFSNNAAAISDISEFFAKILVGVFFAILLLSVALIYLVVNRILSDSRKETAVFRAIGYSRADVAQIYLTYIFIFSLIISVLVIVIVLAATFFAKMIFEPKLSLFFAIFLPIFATGILASVVPIIINTRRSPLKNLRAE
jgi:ABC-type antimicrobial peptide transport system permease subunit